MNAALILSSSIFSLSTTNMQLFNSVYAVVMNILALSAFQTNNVEYTQVWINICASFFSSIFARIFVLGYSRRIMMSVTPALEVKVNEYWQIPNMRINSRDYSLIYARTTKDVDEYSIFGYS